MRAAGTRIVRRKLAAFARVGLLAAGLAAPLIAMSRAPLIAATTTTPTAAGAAPAASVTLEPRDLSAGQAALLQIEVTGPFRLAAAPDLPLTNLSVVAGPSLENRFEWINGRSTSRTLLVYRVRAGKPGRAEIGPIRLVDPSGRTATTEPLSIVVGGAEEDLRAAPEAIDDPALVGRLEPSSPYVGQQAVWTLYLVTRGQATQGEIESLPDFRGFWAEDLEREGNVTPKVWNVGGVLWRAYPMIRKALFPIRAGKLTIGPARARMAVRRLSFDFFDSPFGDESPVQRSSSPLSIACRPKPAAPEVPVGTFTLKESLDRTRVALGGAFAVTAQLSGDGRLAEVAAPLLAIPGARVSEPEARLTVKRTAARLSSSKTWQWVVTPEHPGEIGVPALTLAAFDPNAGRLVSVASTPLHAVVEAAIPAAPAAPPPPAAVERRVPAGWIAGAAGLALMLGLGGFWLGRRARRAAPAADEEIDLPPEERLDRLLDSLARSAAGRGDEGRARIAAWRRRLEEIRYAPVFSSRDEAARALELELREEAGRGRNGR